MYIGTIKSQTAFVRYSLLRIEVDPKSHWQETAAVEPANSSHASICCLVVTTRVCSYFWKSSDLMSICHLYLADILNHVSSTSCLHHCLHHKVSCEPIWALFRDLCHWWGFHDGSAHDNKPGRINHIISPYNRSNPWNQQGLKSLITISGPRYQGLLSWFLDVGRLTSANDWIDQWMLMDFCETTWIYRWISWYHDISLE